jgi:hypothetical protein
MGQPRGITLTGGQLQSGILFTLPGDEVITNARLGYYWKPPSPPEYPADSR